MKKKPDLLIKNISIVDPEKKFSGVFDVLISGGKIAEISPDISKEASECFNGSGFYLCPGFIDIHCHLRDPGFTHKEDIKSGGIAAIAGGYTCICPVANTEPVVDSADHLLEIINRGKTATGPDIMPFSSITRGLKGLEPVNFSSMRDCGAVSFTDDGVWLENRDMLVKALKFSKESGVRISLHEEMHGSARGSSESEVEAIRRDLEILSDTGGSLHIMHVSLRDSCRLIEEAKKSGLDVTCEVTPHHLVLRENDIKIKGTNAKCNPPLRSEEDADYLVEALSSGIVDAVSTDHAPHSKKEKNCLYGEAPDGIIGFQTAFSVLLGLYHQDRISLLRVIECLTIAPSKIFDIKGRGRVIVGGRADLVIFDLNKEYVFKEDDILSKSKNSPFIGRKFKGGPLATIHEGSIKYISKVL